MVDHSNRVRTDNRADNLRFVTRAQNNHNSRPRTSVGYKGVYYKAKTARWTARIQLDGKTNHLGTFSTSADAARAYDVAARRRYGAMACLNFPDE